MVHSSQQNTGFRKPVSCIVLVRNGHLRTIKIKPWAAGLVICAVAVLLSAFVGATGYLVYRDELLGSTFARQVRMQYEYEDRIAALRSELDRTTSKHVIETQGVGDQLATLLDRQAVIERQQATLDGLVGKARSNSLDVAQAAPPTPKLATRPAAQTAPAAIAYVPAEPGIDDIITGSLMGGGAEVAPDDAAGLKPILSDIRASMDAAQADQGNALKALDQAARREAEKLSSALAPIGIAVEDPGSAEPQGGPFVPAEGLHFVERAAVLNRTLDDIAALRHTAKALPLGRPVAGAKVSSRFGARNDPFLNRPAMHAGLDFVAAAGAAVRAAGPGVVVTAGWQGGYGQMVEIRHASGISTRYGHLSAVLVAKGQTVADGVLIGRVGSTGRSTGPHLHYETRRQGQPVDPARYLAAGSAL